jgi:hypothetical protein
MSGWTAGWFFSEFSIGFELAMSYEWEERSETDPAS